MLIELYRDYTATPEALTSGFDKWLMTAYDDGTVYELRARDGLAAFSLIIFTRVIYFQNIQFIHIDICFLYFISRIKSNIIEYKLRT